jgi:glycosyltransferase involved in cell wall biosynthesis
MLALYASHLAFVFPSLHDAGPQVVLEAYGHGLPVICLDIGGPAQLLPDGCGFKISVRGRSSHEVVSSLSQAMGRFIIEPDLRRRMSDACIAAARERTWQKLVTRAYALVEMRLAAATNVGKG